MSEALQAQILDGVARLAAANQQLSEAARELAVAEHAYRQAKAFAYLDASARGEKKTVDHLKAIVDKQTDKEMLRVRMAESSRDTAMQLVLSLRTEISAVQSLLRREIEEASAIRYHQAAGA